MIDQNQNILIETNKSMRDGGVRWFILHPVRTEYGKKVRKQYESHKFYTQRKNLQKLVPRTDGCSNTITTVLKDNLVLEVTIERLEGLKGGD